MVWLEMEMSLDDFEVSQEPPGESFRPQHPSSPCQTAPGLQCQGRIGIGSAKGLIRMEGRV